MKKVLLGTTALFAIAALPHAAFADDQPVKLGISGYFQFGYGAALQQQSNFAPKSLPDGMKEYGVVDLSGDTKFADGLGAGAFIELFVPTQTTYSTTYTSHSSVALRQDWVHLTGDSFGEVRFGDYTDARRAKAIFAPTWSQNAMFGANSPDIAFIGSGAVSNSTAEWVGNQFMTEAAYFSPTYDGFQLALTYAPDDTVGANSGAGGGGVLGFDTYTNSAAAHFGYRDVFSAAASWTGTVSGFTISAAAGLTSASGKQGSSTTTSASTVTGIDTVTGNTVISTIPGVTTSSAQTPNAFVWNAGATVGYGPWSVGGSYEQFHDATYYTGTATNSNDKTLDVGATYTVGNLTAGAEWSRGYRKSVGGTSSYILDTVTPGASYILGPGVDVDAGVAYNLGHGAPLSGAAQGHETILELGTEVKF